MSSAAARKARASGSTTCAHEEFRDVAFDHNRLVVLALSADLCARLGDSRRAALLEPLVAPFANQHVVVADGLGYLDAVARPLGLLALARGDHPRAAAHLEEALRIHESIGAPARAAHTALDLARVVDSRSRAAELLVRRKRRRGRSASAGSRPGARERATLH